MTTRYLLDKISITTHQTRQFFYTTHVVPSPPPPLPPWSVQGWDPVTNCNAPFAMICWAVIARLWEVWNAGRRNLAIDPSLLKKNSRSATWRLGEAKNDVHVFLQSSSGSWTLTYVRPQNNKYHAVGYRTACWHYVSLILPRYSVHQWMPAEVVTAAVGPLQASMTPLITALRAVWQSRHI